MGLMDLLLLTILKRSGKIPHIRVFFSAPGYLFSVLMFRLLLDSGLPGVRRICLAASMATGESPDDNEATAGAGESNP
jgi:hypothetical protein